LRRRGDRDRRRQRTARAHGLLPAHAGVPRPHRRGQQGVPAGEPARRPGASTARRGRHRLPALAEPAPPGRPGPPPSPALGDRVLALGERRGGVVAGLALMGMRRRRDPRLANCTVDAVLGALGQSEHARASFWNPVAVATLNESPERAAAGPFVEVLARAFFRSRADSKFVLPRVGLGDLYTDDARRFVEQSGGHGTLRGQAGDRNMVRVARSALYLMV